MMPHIIPEIITYVSDKIGSLFPHHDDENKDNNDEKKENNS